MLHLFKNIFITVLFIKYTYCKYVSNDKTVEEINQSEHMLSKFNTATHHEKRDLEISKQRKINYCDDDPCDAETTFCEEYAYYEEDGIDDFICRCKPGYRVDPDVFVAHPNKDKCIDRTFCDDGPCDQETTVCVEDEYNDYICKCKPGYRLKLHTHKLLNQDKCIAKNYCDDDPCDRETTVCEEDYSWDFVCKCKEGYKIKLGGDHFKNKDACIVKYRCPDNPCDQETTTCVEDYMGSYYCVCIEGYKVKPGVSPFSNQDKCIVKKFCVDDPCDLETAICEDHYKEGYRCICKPGYKPKPGLFETQDKDKCINCTCGNGECVMKEGKVVCECLPGYGLHNFASECIACNCGEGANCTIKGILTITIHCICKEGFTLDTTVNKCIGINEVFKTEHNHTIDRVQPASIDNDQLVSTDTTEPTTTVSKDICQPNTCSHGECEVIDSHYVCRCSFGYVGRNCEERKNASGSKHLNDDVLIISLSFLINLFL